MHPILFTIGPVSLTGFIIFSASALLVWFIASRFKELKKTVKKDILVFALVLIAAAFILMTGKWVLPIRLYGLMIATGFIMATWFTARQGEKVGIPANNVVDAGVIALFFGILGSRLYHVFFVDPSSYFDAMDPGKWKRIFAIWEGGQVLYGGVILGGIALFIYLRRKKIPLLKFMDLGTLSMLIGIGFGRLGCFSSGCCYGKESSVLGVCFPKESPAWYDQLSSGLITGEALRSLPVLPTQLFSSAGAFLLFGLLFLFHKKASRFDGHTFCVTLITYSIARFFMDMLRELPLYGGTFTAGQWTSMLILVFAVILLVFLRRRAASRISTN